MRALLFTMVRNEHDIIEEYVAHVNALFDTIVFIDHLSEDGTRDYLKSLARFSKKFHIIEFNEPGYYQSEVINAVVRQFPAMPKDGWLFFLDCDEFLPFADKTAFREFLQENHTHPIIDMRWKNIIPEHYWGEKCRFDRPFWVPKHTSNFGKVAIQASVLAQYPQAWIAQGAHFLNSSKYGPPLYAVPVSMVYHMPVRSLEHLRLKMMQGVRSYLSKGRDHNANEGEHWFTAYDLSTAGELREAHLNELVLTYGENMRLSSIGISPDDLNKRYQHEILDLDIALKPIVQNVKWLTFDDLLRNLERQPEIVEVETEAAWGRPYFEVNGTEIRQYRRYEFETLPANAEDVADIDFSSPFQLLYDFLRPAAWQINYLPPTMWQGHIPFLFCLFNLMRPRVYTELGAHHGGSFFAACQAIQTLQLAAKCVAVDTWAGDEHTGAYDAEIFMTFDWHRRTNYDHFAIAKRMLFDEAVNDFADRSIDLLHIDGLHTYEAVSHDFYTWINKMSARGVVLFHDTNEFHEDFGVWRFWQEIRETYPGVEFKHGHGLGVLYVGEEKQSPTRRFIELLMNDEQAQQFLQWFLSTLSETKAQNYLMNFQNEQLALREAQLVQRHNELQERYADLRHIHSLTILDSQEQYSKELDILRTQQAELVREFTEYKILHAQSIAALRQTVNKVVTEKEKLAESHRIAWEELRLTFEKGSRPQRNLTD